MLRRNLILLVAAMVVLTGCSRASSDAYTTQTPATDAPATTGPTLAPDPAPDEPITFSGFGFHLHTAGQVGEAEFKAAWTGVIETLNRYLEAAVLTPLRTGGPAGDLTPLFTPLAVDKAMTVGPERAALIDEGLPPASGLKAETARAGLNGLAGTDGTMSVVVAGLDLRLTGFVSGVPLTVVRTGEMTLFPEGGTWRIDGYDIKVVRTLADDVTTTTAHS